MAHLTSSGASAEASCVPDSPDSPLPPLEPVTNAPVLIDQVYARLRDAIADLTLPPADGTRTMLMLRRYQVDKVKPPQETSINTIGVGQSTGAGGGAGLGMP